MAEAASQSDQSESMEEILKSIKRIMDDNTVAEPAKPAAESDVYDLTNIVKEGKAMSEQQPPAAPRVVEPEPDFAEPEAVAEAEPLPVSLPPRPALAEDDASLLSRQTQSAAAQALKQIAETSRKDYSIPNIPSPHFRSGATIEDLVLETLKPMLKSWLDENLPIIVKKIVEKEVKRIVTFHYNE